MSTEISEDSCVARLYQLEFQISISVSIDVSAFISIEKPQFYQILLQDLLTCTVLRLDSPMALTRPTLSRSWQDKCDNDCMMIIQIHCYDIVMIYYGGFLRHRGTPKSSKSWTHFSIETFKPMVLGCAISGNHHVRVIEAL